MFGYIVFVKIGRARSRTAHEVILEARLVDCLRCGALTMKSISPLVSTQIVYYAAGANLQAVPDFVINQ